MRPGLLLLVILLCWAGSSGCGKSRKLSRADVPGQTEGTTPPRDLDTLIRVCPEAWYINAMPVAGEPAGQPPREYLVIGGRRVEIVQADTAWILQHCDVLKEVIY
ncbi:MAG: hypothetical protein KF690_02375 [Bacteroidetes bacterium]|nr:hypothetical protein [Bacteroidota bacterium]